MNRLASLPNQEGFRFIGIDLEENKIPCIVGTNSIGMYEVFKEENREPYWCRLQGWLHYSV